MKTKEIHIRVTDEVFEAVENLALLDKRKKTAIIDIALENYLKKRKMLK